MSKTENLHYFDGKPIKFLSWEGGKKRVKKATIEALQLFREPPALSVSLEDETEPNGNKKIVVIAASQVVIE